MLDLAKRNESGRTAERRTEVFLLSKFWVRKLSVEIDGAVFLVNHASWSVEPKLQKAAFSPAAVVQSLSCSEGNEVGVAKLLVESSDRQPHVAFFLSVLTVDRFGVLADYFFSAEEVQSCFKRKSSQNGEDVFIFRITDEQNFSQFQRKASEKVRMILKALSRGESERDQDFLNKILDRYRSGPVEPLMVQVSENHWQMRLDQTLFEFEQDENKIIHGSRVDSSGQKQLTPFLPFSSIDDFRFDPFNEEWVQQSR